MQRFRQTGGLSHKLVWLILLSFLPTVFLLVYLGLALRRENISNSQYMLLNSALEIAGEQKSITAGINELLYLLSNTSVIAHFEKPQAEALFREMKAKHDYLKNIQLIDLQGRVVASALPSRNAVSVADERYFTETVRTRAFSAGEYMVGRISRSQVFHFAHPILGPDGELDGVVAVAMDLTRYLGIFTDIRLPAEATLSIYDRNGALLMRQPEDDPLYPTGGAIRPKHLERITAARDSGVFNGTNLHGVDKIYAFVKLQLGDFEHPYLYVLVGEPVQVLLRATAVRLSNSLMTAAAALLLSIALGLFGMKKVVVDRLRALGRMATQSSALNACLLHRPGARDEIGTLDAVLVEMSNRIVDSTEALRSANLGLQAETLRLQEVLDRLPVGVLVIDHQRHEIRFANRYVLDLLRRQAPDVLGRDCGEFFQQACTGECERCGQSSRPEFHEAVMADSDGRALYVIKCLTRIRFGAEESILVALIDKTEQKRLEDLKADIESVIRHDLRTPLSAVVYLPRKLKRGANITPEQKDLLNIMEYAGHRALQLINLSLEAYKIETNNYVFEPTEVDLVRVVRENLRIILLDERLARQEVRFRFGGRPVTDDASLLLRSDPLLLGIIVGNLVKNAVEASDSKSVVELDLARQGRVARLTVHNPEPVPETMRGCFFEKYSTAGKYGGTGLGTYSAAIMTRAIGGEIEMRTSEAEGTTISISLPLEA